MKNENATYVVSIPERTIQTAINSAVESAFRGWDGEANRAIVAQVKTCIATIDWSPMIREAIDRLSPAVVEDTTVEYLRKNVQKVIKEMRNRGNLLPAELFREEAKG